MSGRAGMALALVALSLLGAAPSPESSSAPESEGDRYVREGRDAYERGDYRSALNLYSQALLRRPGDPRLRQSVLASYEKLLGREAAPPDLSSDELRAMVRQAQRVLDERRSGLRESLRTIRRLRRETLSPQTEDLLGACRGVDLVLDVTLGDDPDSRAFERELKGLCGDLADGARKGRAPGLPARHRLAGYLAFCEEDWAAAVREWDRALALGPDKRLKALRDLADRRGREAEGRARAARALDEAQSLLDAGKAQEAEAVLSALGDDSDERVRRLLAGARADAEDARREERLARLRSDARAADGAGRPLEATERWLAVLDLEPADPEARRRVAALRDRLAEDLSRLGTARASPAPSADREAADAKYGLGLMAYSQGDLAEAERWFGESLKLDPGHPYARRALERVRAERP